MRHIAWPSLGRWVVYPSRAVSWRGRNAAGLLAPRSWQIGDADPVKLCRRMSSDERAMFRPEPTCSSSRPRQQMPGHRTRTCRNERVDYVHVYALTCMLAHVGSTFSAISRSFIHHFSRESDRIFAATGTAKALWRPSQIFHFCASRPRLAGRHSSCSAEPATAARWRPDRIR